MYIYTCVCVYLIFIKNPTYTYIFEGKKQLKNHTILEPLLILMIRFSNY